MRTGYMLAYEELPEELGAVPWLIAAQFISLCYATKLEGCPNMFRKNTILALSFLSLCIAFVAADEACNDNDAFVRVCRDEMNPLQDFVESYAPIHTKTLTVALNGCY